MQDFQALWDTGATNSCITQKVIDAMGLAPTGMAQVVGVNGPADSETYLVNIYLPNFVGYQGVKVTRGSFIGADVLIGMDIIATGDFAITNQGGETTFSFRFPSMVHLDFVEETNRSAAGNRASRRAQSRGR